MSDKRLGEEHQIPTPDTIDFSKVPREAQEGFYESWRIQEWIGTTSKILNLRLQPGFAKFKKGRRYQVYILILPKSIFS